MASHPRRPATLVACLALAVGACGAALPVPSDAPSSTAAPSAPSPSVVPDVSSPLPAPTRLLEVTSEGGFINPLSTLSASPAVVVETDGRIFTPGVASGDGLVAPVEVRDVGAAGAAAILDAMRAAGLDHELSDGGPTADTGATVFTAEIDGQTIVSRLVTVGPGRPGMPGGPGGSDPGGTGAAALDLLARLTDPSVAWGGVAPASRLFVPVGYRIWAAPAGVDASAGPLTAWPLAVGLAALGRPSVPDFGAAGLRTGIVTGEDAATLRPVLEAAPSGGRFGSGEGGDAWVVWARPLLPDETGS